MDATWNGNPPLTSMEHSTQTTTGVPIELARDLMRTGDLRGARKIVEEGIERAGAESDSPEVWQLRFIRAKALELHGHVEESLGYLDSLLPPPADDIESRATLKMRRGECSALLGRYVIAHELLDEAEIMARDAGLLKLQGYVHLSHAFVFFLQQDYVSSDRKFKNALDLTRQVEGWYLKGHALWGIGKTLMIQEHHQEAMPWLEESLQIFENAGARLAVAMVWGELAVCHLGLGGDQTALELLQRMAQVNYEAGFTRNYQVNLAVIGNVYFHRGDYFTAISYYRRAATLAREIKDQESAKKWTRNINLAYARIRLAVDQSNPRTA